MSAKEKVFMFCLRLRYCCNRLYFLPPYNRALILTPLALLYPKRKTKDIIEKRKSELNLQFKDLLYSISASLTAGKSVETAFKEALNDLCILYPDPDTYIIREVEYIVRRLEMNETIEDALEDLAKRSHLEDIQNFTDVSKPAREPAEIW